MYVRSVNRSWRFRSRSVIEKTGRDHTGRGLEKGCCRCNGARNSLMINVKVRIECDWVCTSRSLVSDVFSVTLSFPPLQRAATPDRPSTLPRQGGSVKSERELTRILSNGYSSDASDGDYRNWGSLGRRSRAGSVNQMSRHNSIREGKPFDSGT